MLALCPSKWGKSVQGKGYGLGGQRGRREDERRMVRSVFRRGVWIHNFSLFLVFFQYFFAEIEFSFSFYLQVNIKFHVKFARQSLLWASGKVMCFSKYTGTGIKNHLPKLGNKRWKLPLCDCVRTLENWTSHSFYFT